MLAARNDKVRLRIAVVSVSALSREKLWSEPTANCRAALGLRHLEGEGTGSAMGYVAMKYVIEEMTIGHHEQSLALWEQTEGIVVSEADAEAPIERFLARNQGLSFVCLDQGSVVGTSLCGHDGRRGFLYHVAVRSTHRGNGIAGRMVERSLAGLRASGIGKCHLFTLESNEIGNRYWAGIGWHRRNGILLYSRDV